MSAPVREAAKAAKSARERICAGQGGFFQRALPGRADRRRLLTEGACIRGSYMCAHLPQSRAALNVWWVVTLSTAHLILLLLIRGRSRGGVVPAARHYNSTKRHNDGHGTQLAHIHARVLARRRRRQPRTHVASFLYRDPHVHVARYSCVRRSVAAARSACTRTSCCTRPAPGPHYGRPHCTRRPRIGKLTSMVRSIATTSGVAPGRALPCSSAHPFGTSLGWAQTCGPPPPLATPSSAHS